MTYEDWGARADREAAAIVAKATEGRSVGGSYELLVRYVAIGWLDGYKAGMRETSEAAFGSLRVAGGGGDTA